MKALPSPGRWHDPLGLIRHDAPGEARRIVLLATCALMLLLIVWAAFSELDIVATAEGKLVPRTLLKIVQPAEPGVVRQFLVSEGDHVTAGQVLARLDSTLAEADSASLRVDLATQKLQRRRVEAELAGTAMLQTADDDRQAFGQVQAQYLAHRRTYLDSLAQEQAILARTEHEGRSAREVQAKLEQTLPILEKAAQAYTRLEKDGYISSVAAAEKQRDHLERKRDLDAQQASVQALAAAVVAQRQRIAQLQSQYRNDLEKELADIRARIAQLQPAQDKALYREGLMVLRSPQNGVIKDLATTTVGAVVQPGTVLLTLVPEGEPLFADISIRNEDVGFTQPGQTVQVKLATYPFQKYGMLKGRVIHMSADATESARPGSGVANGADRLEGSAPSNPAFYKARVQLDSQTLKGPDGNELALAPGMQLVAEIHQGRRTVLEYLLSPVRKVAGEAGRER